MMHWCMEYLNNGIYTWLNGIMQWCALCSLRSTWLHCWPFQSRNDPVNLPKYQSWNYPVNVPKCLAFSGYSDQVSLWRMKTGQPTVISYPHTINTFWSSVNSMIQCFLMSPIDSQWNQMLAVFEGNAWRQAMLTTWQPIRIPKSHSVFKLI